MSRREKKTAKQKHVHPTAPSNALTVEATSPEDARAAIARVTVESALSNARLIHTTENVAGASTINKSLDLQDLVTVLRDRTSAVRGGSLASAEAMLISQATALESLFGCLAARAMRCDQIPGFEMNMRMALRAQNQCRATLETLAAVKNPPVVFAKQANIAHGHQQVNNSEALPLVRAETENRPNKQLEASVEDAEWMDARPARRASKSHSPVAAVAQVNRAKVRRR